MPIHFGKHPIRMGIYLQPLSLQLFFSVYFVHCSKIVRHPGLAFETSGLTKPHCYQITDLAARSCPLLVSCSHGFFAYEDGQSTIKGSKQIKLCFLLKFSIHFSTYDLPSANRADWTNIVVRAQSLRVYFLGLQQRARVTVVDR